MLQILCLLAAFCTTAFKCGVVHDLKYITDPQQYVSKSGFAIKLGFISLGLLALGLIFGFFKL